MVRRADARKLANKVLTAVHPLAHHGTVKVIAAPKGDPATIHRLAVKIAAVKIGGSPDRPDDGPREDRPA